LLEKDEIIGRTPYNRRLLRSFTIIISCRKIHEVLTFSVARAFGYLTLLAAPAFAATTLKSA
jgi:hypothetical protein